MTTKPETRRVIELAFDPGQSPPVRDHEGLLPVGFDHSPIPRGPLLKAHEVAERLGVTARWVTDKWNAGHLTGYRLPGSNRLRFDWPEVVACLDKNGGE